MRFLAIFIASIGFSVGRTAYAWWREYKRDLPPKQRRYANIGEAVALVVIPLPVWAIIFTAIMSNWFNTAYWPVVMY